MKRIASWFSNLYNGSVVVGFLSKDGILSRNWETSIAFRGLDRLFNFIPDLLKKLFAKFHIAFEGSLLFRLISFLSRNVPVLTAVFLAVSLVVPHNYWNNLYTSIAVLILFGLFLINTMVDKEAKFASKAIDVFLFIFMITVILAQVLSVYPALSLRFFAMYFTNFVLVFLLASSIKTKEQLADVIEIILIGAVLFGLYGVYQAIKGVPVLAYEVDTTLNEGMPGRIFSSFDNANNLAQVIVMLLPLFVAVIMNAKGWQKRLLFGVGAIPLFISLGLTLSRSGWIGLAVAVLVFIFLVKRSLIPLFIILGILAIPFLPDFIVKRLATITNLQDTSTSYRFDIFKTMWPVVKDHWYTGLGLGTDAVKVMTIARDYAVYTKAVPPHFHNLFMEIWIETGIVGILSFLGFIGRLVKKSLRAIFNKAADPYCQNVLKAGLSGLMGILVIGIAEYVWYYPRVMLVFWMLIGIILAALKLSANQEKEPEN